MADKILDEMNSFSLTLTTLAENPEYFEEVIALIEKEFHYDQQSSYANDFAPLMDPLNFENCYFYLDQKTNQVVSHLALSRRTMIKNNIKIPVAFIGGIATVKEFRNRSLFKNLMNHALSTHINECALFFLWSDLTGLYEKFSFYLSGGLVETSQNHFSFLESFEGFQKTIFKNLSNDDFKSIQTLYTNFNEKYFFTTLRGENEWSIIKEMSSVDLYIKKNEQQKIEEYFCINKGKDLTNVIHEIGCLPEKYPALVKSLKKYRLWLPESELSMLENKDLFFTAYIKIGNPEKLKKFLHDLSESLGENILQLLEVREERVSFLFKNKKYDSSIKDFLHYIFGPKALKDFQNLSLYPYIPGVDSV